MKKIIILIVLFLCFSSKIFSQNFGTVCVFYNNSNYMDTLKGKSIQFPQQFLDSIQKYNVILYYQSYPGSKKSSLKSWITFKCPVNQTAAFASYLQTYETALFTEVDYELPDTVVFEFDPIDYYWDKNRIIYTNYYQNQLIDYMWHLKIIQANDAWDFTHGNPNVKIAIIDNRFYCSHPDLIGKINMYDPFDQSWINSNDIHFESHGTKVACIAAGKTNETNGRNASVGFDCGMIAYNAGDNIDIWVEKAHDAAINQKAAVINFSIRGEGDPNIPTAIKQRWIDAITEILDSGTVIVRSAGNNVLEDGYLIGFPFLQ